MGVGGVRRIEMNERENPVFGGTEFDAVGPHERLHGATFGELAARNTQGKLDHQSDFRILKPLDLDRGNGCLVYDVPKSRQPADYAAAQRRAGRRTPLA